MVIARQLLFGENSGYSAKTTEKVENLISSLDLFPASENKNAPPLFPESVALIRSRSFWLGRPFERLCGTANHWLRAKMPSNGLHMKLPIIGPLIPVVVPPKQVVWRKTDLQDPRNLAEGHHNQSSQLQETAKYSK